MWFGPDESGKRVGKVLMDARLAADLKQDVLAKRLSKPQSFVSSYESGQRRIDLLEFTRIAEALSAEPVALFRKIHAAVGTKPKKFVVRPLPKARR